jgi:hypothetical protein
MSKFCLKNNLNLISRSVKFATLSNLKTSIKYRLKLM